MCAFERKPWLKHVNHSTLTQEDEVIERIVKVNENKEGEQKLTWN